MSYGAIFALSGGALQAATQSSNFILVARVVTSLGTGAPTDTTLVFVSETSTAGHRGDFLGYVFIANYLGISVAYWLSFRLAVIGDGYCNIRWRFLLAFQCNPALMLSIGTKMLPDSPCFLTLVGRTAEAREALEHVRGNWTPKSRQSSGKSRPPQKIASPAHRYNSPGYRSDLEASVIWAAAHGFACDPRSCFAGDLNTIGIVGTIISAQIVDSLGRRACLMGGAFGLFAVNLIAASLYEAARHSSGSASRYAPAAFSMLLFSNLVYAYTWGTVAFLTPTKIWSSDMHGQGNGFGITG
ncbi:hypothetical protein LTR16_001503 [Cryomyces antarcticus]|uniref:Major facilitator superfamily (MFS) profile domain-containing protein n=1 Tax=Cryomyces antarcticus TaxID=329879 RepID=A0ABR0KTW7_9PEZI|nr:hypothetical protein LTR39_000978 [Cryomyces antarcticus]KAK5020248.1 hypothetical protein LTR60_000694 [Cryomyces antarcticus]KAK5130468.1 hypothetical protein LTR16_001503 [Cryomyces antarcticus]